MEDTEDITMEATPEQVLYAKVLEKGMYVGLLILFITYAIYMFGILDPYLPIPQLSRLWTQNVHEYLTEAGIQDGWAWVGMLRYGDFVNFIGIAMLAGVTIMCYIAIIPTLLRNNDKVYAALAALEALVLIAAASGLVAGGH